ncbi:PREDICTED: LOW QUALITY PROTEIN: fibroblast growth factor receptor substrate 3 [Ficedula albicollis]|uniref:LOW QUALITY PROTEIN: fibroblast growth factor receptor substrate 3 n=1 Tax=Ficedula albicollis TaxID=59894 RepID=UPI0007AD8E0C|nr:PREDICTED: LOW QUALITY PROTEIN: fibroblast growth factor receptor substrate 3 [Ficedula albicollis]
MPNGIASLPGAMGSCCSCLCPDSIPDNHPTKFKVSCCPSNPIRGSGTALTAPGESKFLPLQRTCKSTTSGLGFFGSLAGIFAFKCSRAEEIFNLLQDLMQCNSINVVEEPMVVTRSSHPSERELARSPQGPSSLGYTGLPNGFHSFPGESLSYSAARHPSVSSLRHSSVGEDSTHPLLGPEEQSHTYVNTATGQREPRGRHCVHSLPEAHPPFPPRNHSCSLEDRNPQVFLQPGEVKFVLAPSSGYRRLCRHPRECRAHLRPPNNNNNDDECQEGCSSPQCVYENLNGLVAPSSSSLCRAKVRQEDGSCCHRRSALLHYENLPALPPVWELQPARHGHEGAGTAPTPSPNGFSEAGEEEPLQNSARNWESSALHSFDFPRPCPEPPRQLNYIQVELEPEPCRGQRQPGPGSAAGENAAQQHRPAPVSAPSAGPGPGPWLCPAGLPLALPRRPGVAPAA